MAGFTFSIPNKSQSGFLNVPTISKEKGQRSLNLDDIYLTKFVSPWVRNPKATADTWRWWVYNEPLAMICRETLVANLLAMDWEIAPRVSSQREELKGQIKYYTKLFERGGNYYDDFDWTNLLEWVVADLLDLPFGSATEVGRRNDSPDGRVMWLKPLDGGTLYPTLNNDMPVIQMYSTYDIVKFPAHAIARMHMSPRTEIKFEGWGMAPPEKIYFALRMAYLSDRYYADLLNDAPPAGILDLMDVEWDSALKWVESLREFYAGAQSAMKIPVLAEHTSEAKFIPFGKNPNDIMFDRISMKYAAIVADGYGLSLSDIGLADATDQGNTLAGSIRDERKSKRKGISRVKKKVKYWVERILPPHLEFNFIDLDDELNVALGRARLATMTALGQGIDKGVIDEAEGRLIFIGDGLAGNVSLPEEPPPTAQRHESSMFNSPERPGTLGNPESAATGGQGEVRKMDSAILQKTPHFDTHLRKMIVRLSEYVGEIIEREKPAYSEDELFLLRSQFDASLFEEDVLELVSTIRALWDNKRWFKIDLSDAGDELKSIALETIEETVKSEFVESDEDQDLDKQLSLAKNKVHGVDWNVVASKVQRFVNDETKTFLGKTIVYLLKEQLLPKNAVDISIKGDDNIVDEVYRNMLRNFDELVHTGIGMQIDTIINELLKEKSE